MNIAKTPLAGKRRRHTKTDASELPLFRADACAGKHGGADTSSVAHARVLPGKRRAYQVILEAIRARGARGCTLHELCDLLGKLPNCLSGRLSEMKALGLLEHALDGAGARVRRGGSFALVEKPGAAGEDAQ